MFSAWLVSNLILGFVSQSCASFEALEDKLFLLKASFYRQTDETNERLKTLQKEVDDLKRENLIRTKVKLIYKYAKVFTLNCKSL